MKETKAFDLLMDCYPSNRKNFSALIRLIRRNVVIPFLGAGFSANYGYKTWRGFLEEQCIENNLPVIRNILENNEYEKAASELKKHLGRGMEYALMQSFGDHIYKVSRENKELEEIPKMFQSLILTTNFDEVIGMLYAKVNGEYIEKLTPKSLNDVRVSYKRIACGEPTLIKLHGDVALKEFVLTEQEYNDIYGRGGLDIRLPLPSFLRDVLLFKVILFMGCSLEDDRTLKVIEQSQIDGSMSFAFLPLPCETRNQYNPWEPQFIDRVNNHPEEKKELAQRKIFLNNHNIIPIWYPFDEHNSLKIFVRALAYYSNSEQNLSTTVVRDTLQHLMQNGNTMKKSGNMSQAFYSYAKAEELVKRNPEAFSKEDRLVELEKIKKFYDQNGYIYECRKIRKEMLELTQQTFQSDSVELAMCYHDIGYAYERFRYYKFMLKAMKKSKDILQHVIKKLGENEKNINACAFVYTSLGYAYLKNNRREDAKAWYQKAEGLYERNREKLHKNEKSFLCNGLYRYYFDLLEDNKKAIQTLEIALTLRKELFCVDKDKGICNQHLVNTYSNIIRILLSEKKIEEAKNMYEAYQSEPDIWERLKDFPDAKRRILTDYGNILSADLNYMEAYNVYQKALQYRKYLHFPNDTITAMIYRKMADVLGRMGDEERWEEAVCYLLMAYAIYEKILGENSQITQETYKELEVLTQNRHYDECIMKRRISVQQGFLKFSYDERLDEREDELILFFEL